MTDQKEDGCSGCIFAVIFISIFSFLISRLTEIQHEADEMRERLNTIEATKTSGVK